MLNVNLNKLCRVAFEIITGRNIRRSLFCLLCLGSSQPSLLLASSSGYITVASTTSTAQSGLFEYLLPIYKAASGIDVRVVAVGTGQAIKLAKNGDADVLLVHHKKSEKEFVAKKFGVFRHDVMFNDFVLLGPASDPAHIGQEENPTAAFLEIHRKKAVFISRGDDSGTHKKERDIWLLAGVDPVLGSGGWYRETGSGMGATLNSAVMLDAYVISDRATWIAFRNKRNHKILLEGGKILFNQYGVILVNPKLHPHIKYSEGKNFIDWLVSAVGQRAISRYRINGEQLFFPNYKN